MSAGASSSGDKGEGMDGSFEPKISVDHAVDHAAASFPAAQRHQHLYSILLRGQAPRNNWLSDVTDKPSSALNLVYHTGSPMRPTPHAIVSTRISPLTCLMATTVQSDPASATYVMDPQPPCSPIRELRIPMSSGPNSQIACFLCIYGPKG